MEREANFDGLVGPSHHYGGLSFGNVASTRSQAKVANPKAAALQGLDKMQCLMEMGILQGVVPPQERPHTSTLRRLGFAGDDAQVLQQAHRQSPALLSQCSSASSMWTANAATVTPSADSGDGRVHFTPANLVNKFHRAIETPETTRLLKALFPEGEHFCHHDALPHHDAWGDEGAANHTRLRAPNQPRGIGFFVYGKRANTRADAVPKRFPARQTLEASQAIARAHGLEPTQAIFAQQHPDIIDAGAFHNDVVAVGNAQVLLCHEKAYLNQQQVYGTLNRALEGQLQVLEIPEHEVSVRRAIETYLFNSQLVSKPDGGMALILPQHCDALRPTLDRLLSEDNPIDEVRLLDVRQSMDNGGGPACLRLRVTLTADEQRSCNTHCLLTSARLQRLRTWVSQHYRDRLSADDLADPELLQANRTALDELTQLLHLGSVYDFQQA